MSAEAPLMGRRPNPLSSTLALRRAISGLAMDDEFSINISMLNRLKLASVIEASTLALLVCVAVPLKHFWHWPAGVRAMGPVHGFAFLFYGWTLLQSAGAGLWQRRQTALLAASAFVPFAGFFASLHIQRRIEALPRELSTR